MEEKSAIELIYEMYTMIQNIEARVTLMEKNIDLLNDKTNGKLLEAIATDFPKGQAPSAKEMPLPPQKAEAQPAPKSKNPQQTSSPLPRQNAKVTGKFADIRNKPIAGIEVTIVDANNAVVKQTKTNRAGRWMSYLPPGHYSAEFIKEGMQPTFRVFQVIQGQSEIEVT